VFEPDASGIWTQVAVLTASPGDYDFDFGTAVAISDDVIVVGSPFSFESSSGVYVFERPSGGWVDMNETQRLDPPSGSSHFGQAVAIKGNQLVVGAPGGDGKAHVYVRHFGPWALEQTLIDSEASEENRGFGRSVDQDGDLIIVGGSRLDNNPSFEDLGRAVVFQRFVAGWTEVARLTRAVGQSHEQFGRNVSLQNGTAILGAYAEDSYFGAAFVFDALSDCNGNGTLDMCDILSGGSQDDDANNSPDECDFVCELANITPSDGEPYDGFGRVDMSGDVLVVGSPLDDDDGNASGSAYVYRYNGVGWEEEQKLTAPDAEANDHFGVLVSMDQDVIVVGSGTATGAAYVFRYTGSTWGFEQKLTASDATVPGSFTHVAIHEDIIVVGDPFNDDACPGNPTACNSGSAYVFRYSAVTSEWEEEQKVTASDAAEGDWFGVSVSASSNVVVVGARLDDMDYIDHGSAYVYRYDNSTGEWMQEQKLIASNTQPGQEFGYSCAVDEDLIVIGRRDLAAHIYRYDPVPDPDIPWVEEEILSAGDTAFHDNFGRSVALAGDVVVVGAPGEQSYSFGPGAAYVYRHDGLEWQQVVKLSGSNGTVDDSFGAGIALNGPVVAVGSASPDAGSDTGSVYLFAVDDDCNANGFADLCDIASGASVDQNADGIPDDCLAVGACCFADQSCTALTLLSARRPTMIAPTPRRLGVVLPSFRVAQSTPHWTTRRLATRTSPPLACGTPSSAGARACLPLRARIPAVRTSIRRSTSIRVDVVVWSAWRATTILPSAPRFLRPPT
jgi:hypothetical protein